MAANGYLWAWITNERHGSRFDPNDELKLLDKALETHNKRLKAKIETLRRENKD